MNIDDLIASMTPEIYKNMRDAVELGRWGDGRAMTAEQKTHSLEALIRYEHLHNIPEEQRVGYVDTSNKKKKSAATSDDTQPLKIIK
ncbi:YeaC family protein [Bermanella sp. R86510]|uniref:YeaC family protein n=1 Tax=unclassified Bermanella TaxID=2627862 RepID=UPI0037C71890